MLATVIQLIVSLVFLVLSADKFVIGSSALAKRLGISPLIIGLSIVAVGTSAPEIFVSTVAAIQGSPDISLGNAIGSNIANIGLILGVCALIHPLIVDKEVYKQDLPFLISLSFIASTLLYCFGLQMIVGVLFLITIVGYFYFLFKRINSGNHSSELDKDIEEINQNSLSLNKAIIFIVLGLVMLPLCSHFLVDAAKDIATYFGVSDLIISLTLVAIGTSLPELAASLAGVYRKEYSIAVGNVIGSNIFNLTGVLAPAAMLSYTPLMKDMYTRDLPAMLVFTLGLYGLSFKGRLSRVGGACLLLMYTYYTYTLII